MSEYYEPPFHPWSAADWLRFFEGDHACFVCNELVDDPRFAVAMEVHRSWVRDASGYFFAHVECLRNQGLAV